MGRILKFDKVLNVRDFGGHVLKNGSQIINGKLYRGGQLSAMTEADREKFQSFGISLVVDLRHQPERERQSSAWSAEMPQTLVYDDAVSNQGLEKMAPHEAFIVHELQMEEEAHTYMLNSYKTRPSDPGFISVARQSLKKMSGSGDSTYIHCAAGKDRTGTFCAYLLLMLGASRDHVIEDYLRTREAAEIGPITKMVARRVYKQTRRKIRPESLRPLCSVHPDYLDQSLKKIGDIDAYWMNTLRLTHRDLDDLRMRYIS